MFIKNYPDEIDFLSFFGLDPIYVDSRDIKFGYLFCDSNGVELLFYFSVTEGWVNIEIKKNESIIVNYNTENVSEILIDEYESEKIIVLKIISEEVLLNSKLIISPLIRLDISSLVY